MAGYKTIFTVWLEVHLIKTDRKKTSTWGEGKTQKE